MLAIRVRKEFYEEQHPRDNRGRFTFTQADLDRLGPKGKRQLATQLNLNLPSGASRYEIEQALEKIALSRPKPVYKEYVSQAQRNLFEACRADPGFSDKCPPADVTEEYHEASRGKMKDKDLPEKAEEKEKKKARKVFIQM